MPSTHPSDTANESPPPATPEIDPLGSSRTSGFWIAVIGLLVVFVLLAVFVLQNTNDVEVSVLAWDGTAPLAAVLLLAAAAGLALAGLAGSLRILQLRRRVKRTRRSPA